MAEFDLIDRIRSRVPARDDVVLGIGDDAAIIQVPAGLELVVCTDTLNAGVHFPLDTAPADIGWKSLAVNLSDLAAMAATPAWCTLSLSMPADDPAWLDGFLDGFLALAAEYQVGLVGGDTTRGPLSINVTAHGLVAPGAALRRDGAQPGDDIWVTGTLGDAAAALAHPPAPAVLRARLDRPVPRVAAGLRLAGVAHCAIDLSDGLLADLAHVCSASGVAARIQVDELPCSPALRGLSGAMELDQRRHLQASGGDDYELCFTAPPSSREAIGLIAAQTDTPMTLIGRIVVGQGVQALDAEGEPWQPARGGYVHFS